MLIMLNLFSHKECICTLYPKFVRCIILLLFYYYKDSGIEIIIIYKKFLLECGQILLGVVRPHYYPFCYPHARHRLNILKIKEDLKYELQNLTSVTNQGQIFSKISYQIGNTLIKQEQGFFYVNLKL